MINQRTKEIDDVNCVSLGCKYLNDLMFISNSLRSGNQWESFPTLMINTTADALANHADTRVAKASAFQLMTESLF